MKNILIIAIITSFLTSCGFQVIYRERDKNAEISYIDELAAIVIQKDPTKLGQKLKNNLYDIMNPDNVKVEPKYFLILKSGTTISSTYITLTGASGRSKANLNVSYQLKILETGQLISTGRTQVNDNYDLTLNRYGSYQAGEEVESNLTLTAAQNLRNSLINDLIEVKRDCKDKSYKSSNETICRIVK